MDDTNLIDKIINKSSIKKIIKKINMTKAEIDENILLLIDIYEEERSKINSEYISTLVRRSNKIFRNYTLSKYGEEIKFLQNIVTKNMFSINPKILTKQMDNEGREEFGEYYKKYQLTDDMKGFYLHGPMGVGKSFLSQRFALHLAKKDKKVAFINVPDFLTYIKSTFSDKNNDSSILEKIKIADALFLDDIGAESVSVWFRDDYLLNILSYRMGNGLQTFFNSNFSYKDLEIYESRTKDSKYPDKIRAKRFMERVKYLSIPVLIKGNNKRILND